MVKDSTEVLLTFGVFRTHYVGKVCCNWTVELSVKGYILVMVL